MRNPPTQQVVPITREELDRDILRAIVRLKCKALALVLGLISGIGLFSMTAILLIERGPNTGMHLRLLNHFFWGYSVTWKGAFIGFLWAFVTGALIGWLIASTYNAMVARRP